MNRMRRKAILVGIVLLLTVLTTTAALANGICASISGGGPKSILLGRVTALDGPHLSMRSDAGNLYTVDVDKATILMYGLKPNSVSPRVGDMVRVYGVVSGNLVCASRLRIFPSEREAVIVPPVTPPVVEGAGPAEIKRVPEYDVRLPAAGDNLGAWRSRGLVVGVQYRNKLMTISTSSGPFVIDTSGATIVMAKRSVSLAKVSQGDAVRIWGNAVGLNKIRADRVEVLRDVAHQDGVVTVRKASIVGKIDYIDYPSFTFRVETGTGEAKVMVDENTFVHFQGNTKAFMDLAVGQKVKVYGFGNLASGYVANQVHIIGDPGL